MTLREIKEQLLTATPADTIDLAKEFSRKLQHLCNYHKEYRDFSGEYYQDITKMKFTRSPENAKELTWLVENVIAIGERLKLNVPD